MLADREAGVALTRTRQICLLFVSANPERSDRLALDEEVRRIDQKLGAAKHRDAIDFRTCWATRPDDLVEALDRFEPAILHFSGHGHRQGIVLQAEDGAPRLVSGDSLCGLLRPFRGRLRLVVLNSCFSLEQARPVRKVVDHVVGLAAGVDDEAARVFAAAFYRGLGNGKTVWNAFQTSAVVLQLEGHGDAKPHLLGRRRSEPPGFLFEDPIERRGKNALRPLPPSRGTERTTERRVALPEPPEDVGSSMTTRMAIAQKPRRLPAAVARPAAAASVGTPTHAHAQPRIYTFDVVTLDVQGYAPSSRPGEARGYAEPLDAGGGIALEMVYIPDGTFVMGSPRDEPGRWSTEEPQHPVWVPRFALGRYPVTQAQWRAVAGWQRVRHELPIAPARFPGDNRPVETVSWAAAVEFCERLARATGHGYRLPTEAEWEYAARAGTVSAFHFGRAITPTWVNHDASPRQGHGALGDYRGETTAVGALPDRGTQIRGVANAFGLCDVHGNVQEWCQDAWHDTYAGGPGDGSAWVTDGNATRRVTRGGSWEDATRDCRSAARQRQAADQEYRHVGFRVACSVDP